MPTDLEACFPATAYGLETALAAIDRFAAERNFDSDLVSRLRITVEELFSNTVKYGYGQPCGRPIRLSLKAEPVPTLIYEDEAAAFDPTQWKPDGVDIALFDRPVGKAGIGLILGLSSSVAHRADTHGNQLILTFAARNRGRTNAPP